MPVNILPSCSKEVLLVKIESSHSDEWLLFLFFITCHTTLYPINIHYLCSPKSYKSETEVISVEGLSVEFNATPLFEDVSYVINKKDRIALVGKNGAGKSTMLKILAGLQSPTHGVVATPKDVMIGYLPQVMILADNRTVMGEAELAFEHIFELQARLERMNRELAERTDYESEEYHQLIDRFTHENDRFLMMGGTNYQAEIERTLLGLGFSREDFERPTSEFSGGWRSCCFAVRTYFCSMSRPIILILKVFSGWRTFWRLVPMLLYWSVTTVPFLIM